MAEDADPRFSTLTKARKQALDILFQADMRELPIDEALAEQQTYAEAVFRPLTTEIVVGVSENLDELDRVIASSSSWTIDRMPRVDRCLARMGVFEMLHTETPDSVVISEIVELASWLSTDSSPSFLNGLLAQVSTDNAK